MSYVEEEIKPLLLNLKKNMFENKNMIVTGGAGFLGSWLCDSLILLKSDIISIDNLSTGKKSNIKHLLIKPNFNFIESDISQYDDIKKADYILHFASRASPEDYQNYPIDTLMSSALGTYNLLEKARKLDSVIVYASTSEVYGDPDIIPTPETYIGRIDPLMLRSCYSQGKLFSESLLKSFEKEYGLDIRIVRLFNTYGPRLRPDGTYGRVISRFIMQSLLNQNLTVYGDGSQTRSFCYVKDAIFGILKIIENKNAKGHVFNIGNPEENTILEIAKKIIQLTQSSSSISFCELPVGDPKRRCPNIDKSTKILGWKPKESLIPGLNKTINWVREYINEK